MSCMKVVFEDAGENKVIRGIVTFENDFVKVIDSSGKTILINKKNIVFIREE